MRQAFVIVCDDLLVSLSGKMTVIGVYTNDLGIPSEEHRVNQLVFLFIIEGDLNDPLKSLKVRVKMPSGSSGEGEILVPSDAFPDAPGRKRWIARLPLVMPFPILTPGKIEATVIHDQGEIEVVTPWIVSSLPAVV